MNPQSSSVEPKPKRPRSTPKKKTTARTPKADPTKCIRVRGAREHNLKGIDVDIPRDQLVVITGLSGSGKSSLAFDTIFAEGQRKYMESLSAYARQFLDQLKKPDIEEIEGLPPTIAIEQRSSGHNPRSTVATSTEIYDYLRLLFARTGAPTCWHPTKLKNGEVLQRCGKPISATAPSQIASSILELEEGTRLMVLAPVVEGKKGFHKDVLEEMLAQGFIRARVNGTIVDLRSTLAENEGENPLDLGRYEKHTIEAVIDRVVAKPDARQRLVESVETALKVGRGVVRVSILLDKEKDLWDDRVYSEHFACSDHPTSALSELEPRIFSFNSPYGACPSCEGLGVILEFDEELVCPDHEKTIAKAGIAPFKKNGPGGMYFPKVVRRFCRKYGVDQHTAIGDLSDGHYTLLLYGDEEGEWEGVLELLRAWFEKTESTWVKDHLHQFMSQRVCPECSGDRVRIESLSVFLRTKEALPIPQIEQRKRHGLTTDPHMVNIADLASLKISEARRVLSGLELNAEQKAIAEPIVREVGSRLGFLASVGLEYLSLDRRTNTLSGGEAQRIRLATQVGSGLVGACYVLDEPTIGLHQRDNDRLIATLRHLTDIGNTVIVVEHDEDMIRSADHVVDIGPGPGVHGGEIVAQGTVADLMKQGSLTGQYLSGERCIEVPEERRVLNTKDAVVVKGAQENNLKRIDVPFPLGGLVCVTGVSGSGKSTLVNGILLRATRKHLHGSRDKPGAHSRINGLHKIERVIEVDQSPIGRTPRSNPATYTNLFNDVRNVFVQTKESKIRGYKPGRFSFNVKGGRCEECQGQGTKKIEMHFLPDIHVECETCHGARYNRETLEVLYRGKHIADVLNMTVEDACAFFENHPKILRFTQCLRDVGLGYLTLGQPSTTLSGGEAQRVKLATELGKGGNQSAGAGATLYVLDEPTTGLHFEDVKKLCTVFDRIADAGNTLVVIEHNLDVIKRADWVIDLGPEGGDEGGRLVASGTPEDVAEIEESHTGRYLREMLG